MTRIAEKTHQNNITVKNTFTWNK